MEKISIEENKNAVYPNDNCNFSPSKKYPEYKYSLIADDNNDVYEMVRNALINLGLDKDNIGKKNWNPLGDYIKKGDNVVIKPNFVRQSNHLKEFDISCLVTHPSVLRPMIDYCLIALDGTGSLTIADAPVQNSDFEELMEKNGMNKLVSFYKSLGVEIKLCDLRLSGIGFEKENKYGVGEIRVDLGKDSMFSTLSSKQLKKLRITNYKVQDMMAFHNEDHHIYCISDIVLNADVIINMPKPKTHKKGGVTISLKNMFGCITRKECLPHHSFGSKKEGGDEYNQKSNLKKWITKIDEKQDICRINKGKTSRFYALIKKILVFLKVRFTKTTKETEGSWYGNETLYKTILDINRIVTYADKNGKICKTPQRKMFILADMIVSGERNGPLAPTPKNVGMIIAGDNRVNFDRVVATMMGFDYERIPTLYQCDKINVLPLEKSDFEIVSNNKELNGEKFPYNFSLDFIPADNWIGHIERK